MDLSDQHSRYNELARKLLEGTITAEEKQEYLEWLNREEEGVLEIPPSFAESRQELHNKILYALQSKIREAQAEGSISTPFGRKPGMPIYRKAWLRYAAAILIMFGFVAYFWTNNRNEHRITATTGSLQNDLLPGGDKAILTLADGSRVLLDSANKGKLIHQGDASVIKLDNGQIVYTNTGNNGSSVLHNTMSTPRGGQYRLTLPDGTKVWLNAASSITYPTAFTGNERKVTVTGELYFDVAKDASKPFIVKIDEKTQVNVLGTQFNVNTYRDNGVTTTTLVEGSVQIKNNNESFILKPGQQARAGNQGALKIVNDVNIEQVIAWKKGLFNFNGYDIQTMMREIARWYDLEIVYESVPAYEELRGGVQRNLTLVQVMNILKKVNINYRLEGRKLIITK